MQEPSLWQEVVMQKVIRVGNANYSTKLVNQAKHKNLASSEMRDSIEKDYQGYEYYYCASRSITL